MSSFRGLVRPGVYRVVGRFLFAIFANFNLESTTIVIVSFSATFSLCSQEAWFLRNLLCPHFLPSFYPDKTTVSTYAQMRRGSKIWLLILHCIRLSVSFLSSDNSTEFLRQMKFFSLLWLFKGYFLLPLITYLHTQPIIYQDTDIKPQSPGGSSRPLVCAGILIQIHLLPYSPFFRWGFMCVWLFLCHWTVPPTSFFNHQLSCFNVCQFYHDFSFLEMPLVSSMDFPLIKLLCVYSLQYRYQSVKSIEIDVLILERIDWWLNPPGSCCGCVVKFPIF